MKNVKKISKKINELLISNVETERVFLNLLDSVDNTLLKNFLRVAGYERNQFIKGLDLELRNLGTTPTYPEDSLNNKPEITKELRRLFTEGKNNLALNRIGRLQIKVIEKYKKLINNVDFEESTEKLLKEQLDKMITMLYSIDIHKDLLSRAPISA
ncbi:MAG: hypothetical protein ACON5F_08555 [Jejuia sp.]